MAVPSIELKDRFDAWHASAWHGTWNRRKVVVVVGPAARGLSSLALAREAAAPVLGLQEDGVLELLEVTTHDGKLAWIYEPFEGIALGAIRSLSLVDALPLGPGVEIVAQVAEILGRTSSTIEHRGPDRIDVLIDRTGRVRLAGFVGPWRPSGGLMVPGAEHGEASAVYRLGALLADLIAGAPPAPIEDPEAQSAAIRRILAGLSDFSPGPHGPGVGRVLERMLAWEGETRPGLAEVATLLRGASRGATPTLVEWAEDHVPGLQERSRLVAERIREEAKPVAAREDPDGDGDTTPGVAAPVAAEEIVEDDPTHVADTEQSIGDAPTAPRPQVAPAQFPVQVGPPAEVVKRAPRLPKGFLEDESGDFSTAALKVVRASARPVLLGLVVAFASMILVLGVVASLLGRGGGGIGVAPRLSDALPSPSSSGRFDVVFFVRGDEPFEIRCAGGAQAAGVDGATVRGVLPGRCVIDGHIDGVAVQASIEVTHSVEVRCFQTRQPVCQ